MKASEHIYHRCSFLRKSKNNILLLLTWTFAIHDRALRILNEWANSKDALNLCRRLVEDFQNTQKSKQLVLILIVLLCHERLLFYISNDTIQFISDCYLVDLDVLLSDKSLSNQRTIFERVNFSFLRILVNFDDKYENIIQFLTIAIDKISSLLKSFDELTNQYVIKRIKNRDSHSSACKRMKNFRLMKQVLKSNTNVNSSSQSIDYISKDY